jgi:hypothetical protein
MPAPNVGRHVLGVFVIRMHDQEVRYAGFAVPKQGATHDLQSFPKFRSPHDRGVRRKHSVKKESGIAIVVSAAPDDDILVAKRTEHAAKRLVHNLADVLLFHLNSRGNHRRTHD